MSYSGYYHIEFDQSIVDVYDELDTVMGYTDVDNQEENDEFSTSYVKTKKSKRNNANKNRKHMFDNNILLYSNFRVITRTIPPKQLDNNKIITKEEIGIFTTNSTPGFHICDAITGSKYNFKVGTRQEDYFFKVKLTNYNLGHDVSLFFETPSTCEKYLNIVVSDDVKDRWKEKHMRYIASFDKK